MTRSSVTMKTSLSLMITDWTCGEDENMARCYTKPDLNKKFEDVNQNPNTAPTIHLRGLAKHC